MIGPPSPRGWSSAFQLAQIAQTARTEPIPPFEFGKTREQLIFYATPFHSPPAEVLAIGALLEFFAERNELVLGDEILNVRDFLGTRDPKTLTLFQGLNKRGCLKKTVVRPHVEPCETTPHPPDIELAAFEVNANDICYFKFSASGRL